MTRTCHKGIRFSVLNKLWSASLATRQIWPSPDQETESASQDSASSPEWNITIPRLLDLRSHTDFLGGHIPGSCVIPAAEIESRIFELPPKWRQLILFSDDPAIAKETANNLFARGWTKVMPILDPIGKWTGPHLTGPATGMLWEATPIVTRWQRHLRPGRVLDLGCGSGRDSVTLSMMGGDVTAVDLLPDALAMAEQLADRMNVYIAPRLMDLRNQRPPVDEQFDTILMIRFLERPLIPWIVEILSPGGLLILEVFRQETKSPTKSPHSKKLESGEGIQLFTSSISTESGEQIAPLQILEYAECLDESGQAVTRLVARKPS